MALNVLNDQDTRFPMHVSLHATCLDAPLASTLILVLGGTGAAAR